MTFFQFKKLSLINIAIKRIVEYIKYKGTFYIANLTNKTFWKNTPRGQEILEFFKGMTNSETIEFFCLFDIFFVGYHNGMNAYVSMTANPSSQNFEKTLWVSISKGYKQFTERCSGRETPSIKGDLRSSIGSSPVQPVEFSTSPAGFQGSSYFPQWFQTFGEGPAQHPVSQAFRGFGGPASGFSLFSAQPPSLGRSQQIAQEGSTNLFTSQADSSGPSTYSIVRITKSSKAKTHVSTTIANLEKKIAQLESENLREESLNHLDLQVARAKLEKIRKKL